MKKITALILAAVLILGLAAGCGTSAETPVESTSEVESVAVQEPVEVLPAEVEPDSAPAESSVLEEAAPKFTGEVIPAEECQANGYDVRYGMYDFETYVELPLTEDGDVLTYWVMMQPFMMGYNNVTVDDFTYYKEMEARTGVHLDITAVSMFSVAEQFALMVTSGDYSDLIEGAASSYSGGAAKAVEDGMLLDLNPYLDLMPNYAAWIDSDPSNRGAILTLNGELPYAALFSETERNVGPQVRGDWLEALGLESPVTYDDYHEVLVAFKNEYNAGLWLDSNGSQRNNALSAGYNVIVNNEDPACRPFRVVDGIVELSAATEDYREFMKLMNSWWAEGLIYEDFLAQQNVSTPDTSIVLNDQVGIWAADNNTMVTYDSLGAGIEIMATPLPRQEAGQTLHLYSPAGKLSDGTSISTTCSDPELAARWLDYNYTYDGTLLMGYGIEGEGLTFDEEGKPMYTDLVLNNPDMITVACSLMYSKYGGAGVIDVYRFTPSYTQKQLDATALWLDNLDTEYEYPASVQLTLEESEIYSNIISDLDTYFSQTALKFITGDLSPESDWDSYIADLESLRMNEIVELCQIAYDRYLEMGAAG